MVVAHQIGKELQEKREYQQPDVHSVHVGIGGDHNLVVAQRFQAVLNVQGVLQQVEFLIFVHHFLGQPEAVERLATQAEHGLQIHVARLRDRAAGRVAFGDEQRGVETRIAFFVGQVHAAVAQFLVVQVSFLGAFVGEFLDARNLLAFAFRLPDALFNGLGYVLVLVQVVVQVPLHEVADEFAHRHTVGGHVQRAEFGLGLRLEHRVLHPHADGGNGRGPDVGGIVVLAEKLADRVHQRFAESGQVRAALCGVLAVDERIIFLAILVAVRENQLNILAFEVYDRVAYGIHVGAALQQIEQAVLRIILLPVEHNRQSGVQIGVIPNLVFQELRTVMVMLENGFVRFKRYQSAVFFVGGGFLGIRFELAQVKFGGFGSAFAERLHLEKRRKGVDGLGSHAVQPD